MKNILSAAIISLILAVWMSGMYLVQPSRELLGDFGDKYEFFLFQYLVHDRLAHHQYPLQHTDMLRYPVGFELGHGYDGALPTFTGAMLQFYLSPPLAYNVTIVLVVWLNLLFSLLFFSEIARHTRLSWWSSMLLTWGASLMYASSPYVMARINAGHLNLALVAGFPFLGYALLRLVDRIQQKKITTLGFSDLGLGTAAVLLIAAGSLQYIIMLAYVVVMAIVGLLLVVSFSAVARQNVKEFFSKLWMLVSVRTLVVAVTMMMLAAMIGGYFYGPYLQGMASGSFVYTFDFANYYRCCVASPADLLVPNQYLGSFWKQINLSPSSVERVVTMGIVEWALVAWIIVKTKSRTLRLAAMLGCALFAGLALAWIRLPYWPEGGRSVIVLSLVFLAALVRKGIRPVWLVLIILVLVLGERALYPVYRTQPFPFDDAKLVADLPGTAVLDIPVSKYNPYHSSLPYVYGKKVVDGYFHDTAENERAVSFLQSDLIQRYICDAERPVPAVTAYNHEDYQKTVQLFRSLDIRTIVIQKDPVYEKWIYDSCANVRYWWYSLVPDQIMLGDSTEGNVSQTLMLVKQPRLKAQIYFLHSGTFTLNGLFIVPGTLRDTVAQLPDGTSVRYAWEPEGNGIRTPSVGQPITISVQAGDAIDIISQKKTAETIYVTAFYQFTASDSAQVFPAIQKRFSTNVLDVYTVE